ncbi:MAG: YqhA family protein [Psychroserpens sp.]|uniref:YqhA family protein n=1 Tax=Psychroserpens sp. TaxID=2020870 RepID=UPI003002C2BE
MKTFFKFIIGIPVICSFFIAIIFLGLGIYQTGLGIEGIIKGEVHTVAAPGIKLVKSLDLFLVGFLFMVFLIGFGQLFIPKPSKLMRIVDSITPPWLRIEIFFQLQKSTMPLVILTKE